MKICEFTIDNEWYMIVIPSMGFRHWIMVPMRLSPESSNHVFVGEVRLQFPVRFSPGRVNTCLVLLDCCTLRFHPGVSKL